MNPSEPPPRDEENPYAPPRTNPRGSDRDFYQTTASGFEHVESFSIENVLRRAWRLFQARLGITLAIVLGVWAMDFGFQFVGNLALVSVTDNQNNVPVAVLANLAFLLSYTALVLFLAAGQTVALLKLARNSDASFGEVFGAGRFFWRILFAYIALFFVMCGVYLAVGLPVGLAAVGAIRAQDPALRVLAIGVAVLFGLAGIGAAIYLTMRCSQFLFILVDDDCGPLESLQRSWELTRGRVVELFVISLLAGLILIAGALFCLVGLIFTFPFYLMMLACSYVCLTGRGAPVAVDTKKTPRDDLEFIDFIS